MNKYSKKDLVLYMIDVHELDGNEWPTKQDLIDDIKFYGWESDCMEYLA